VPTPGNNLDHVYRFMYLFYYLLGEVIPILLHPVCLTRQWCVELIASREVYRFCPS
jgi:hypothetical protein